MTKEASTSAPTVASNSAKAWCDELSQAKRREKDFRKEGRDVLSIYQGEKVATTPFNILYSNTETLSPALYNQKPRPVVKRRYDDRDPLAREVSMLLRRGLEYMIDDVNQSETGFSEAMVSAVTQALLPGRGVTRFRYNAEVVEDEQGPREISYEDIEIEEIDWCNFLHGYAKKWRYVPWVAFKEPPMTRAELIEQFGEIGAFVPVAPPTDKDSGEEDEDERRIATTDEQKVAEVWQIWDKRTKQVHYVAPAYPDAILKTEPPPTKFKGFFPCPQPLTYFQKVGDLVPRNLYSLYKSQAEELNQMTRRIKAIIQAIKVRGAYDSSISEMEKVLQAEENKLIPIPNAQALYAQAGGLDRAIWLWPVEKLQSTLQTLYQQREAAKQTLYEITGIADIMRGSSVASETLGAQQIKAQWGTMRLKRMQSSTARYVRDSLRLMAEILAHNFSVTSLQRMTNTKFMSSVEKQKMEALQEAAGPSAAQAVPPEILEAMKLPTLEEVQELLQNELDRCYRIDVETNSTVDVEATEDKEAIGESLNAIAQFMNGIGPLVEQGALPMSVAKQILMSVCRRFRFGEEVEKAIEQIPDQQPAPPKEGGDKPAAPTEDPAVAQQLLNAKAQAEAAKAQTAVLLEQQKQMTIRMENELLEKEHAYKLQEINAKAMSLSNAASLSTATHMQRMQQAKMAPGNKAAGGGSAGSGSKQGGQGSGK